MQACITTRAVAPELSVIECLFSPFQCCTRELKVSRRINIVRFALRLEIAAWDPPSKFGWVRTYLRVLGLNRRCPVRYSNPELTLLLLDAGSILFWKSSQESTRSRGHGAFAAVGGATARRCDFFILNLLPGRTWLGGALRDVGRDLRTIDRSRQDRLGEGRPTVGLVTLLWASTSGSSR